MRILFIVLMFALCVPARLQGQINCPPMPAESPQASSSPADVPPANYDIITATGAIVKARANLTVAMVEISPNDQRVWFGVDSHPGARRVFYNRRLRDA